MSNDWTTLPPTDLDGPPAAEDVPAALGALRALLTAADAATLIFRLDGTVLDANPAGKVLFRGPDSVHPGGRLPMHDVIDQVPQRLFDDPDGGEWRGEITTSAPDQPGATYAVTVVVRQAPESDDGGFIAVMARDITDQVARTSSLSQHIERDAATGLLTRSVLLDRLTHALGEGRRDLAVLLIDIDNLGEINGALGHPTGDQVLVSTAHRLAGAVRPVDPVARSGGDEFLVLCHDVSSAAVATEMADRVRRVLTGRVGMTEFELDLSVSVGASIVDASIEAALADSPRTAALAMVADADLGLHSAKRSGRAKAVLATDDLRVDARRRHQLAAELHRALRSGELHLEFQPIFSAVSEKAAAAEALLRWDHPEQGRLEAAQFVRIAEETGVIVPIGDWVIDQALAATRHWTQSGTVDDRFGMHVNVSRLQLSDPGFVNRVVDLLGKHELRPRQLVVETREATLLNHGDPSSTDAAIRTVRSLRRLGVRVAIDNFGTGSAALSLLTEVGADVLKLDGALALPGGASEAENRVVRAVVMLAHALDMEVVAERVTGVEQLRRLRAAGCDLVQGHLVGMPAPAERFS